MNKQLIDSAWRALPAEFKKEVKTHYAGLNAAYKAYLSKDSLSNEECDRCNVLREKMALYQMYFGHHNLTSDAEGEEMLTVSCKRVQEIYKQAGSLETCNALDALFGSKCLPDDAHEDNFTSKEPTLKRGDIVRVTNARHSLYEGLIGTVDTVVKGECHEILVNHRGSLISFHASELKPYEEPKPAEDVDFNVPEPNCKHFKDGKCAHPSVSHIENGKLVKGADCDVSSCEDVEYDPKRAEPKFTKEDMVHCKSFGYEGDYKVLEYSGGPRNCYDCIDRDGYHYRFYESDLEPCTSKDPIPPISGELKPQNAETQLKEERTEPNFTDDCKSQDHIPESTKMVDDIIARDFDSHNRLHIAAMAMAGLLANEGVSCFTDVQELGHMDFITYHALEYADKLIKKLEEDEKLAEL